MSSSSSNAAAPPLTRQNATRSLLPPQPVTTATTSDAAPSVPSTASPTLSGHHSREASAARIEAYCKHLGDTLKSMPDPYAAGLLAPETQFMGGSTGAKFASDRSQ